MTSISDKNPTNNVVATLSNSSSTLSWNCNPNTILICNALPHYCLPDFSVSCTDLITKKLNSLSYSHNSSSCSTLITTCKIPSCLTCSIFNTSHFFRSTITGRVYHIDSPTLNCKSRNLIYLLTCLGCHLQYVGETRQELQNRMSDHRSSLNVN